MTLLFGGEEGGLLDERLLLLLGLVGTERDGDSVEVDGLRACSCASG